VVGRVSLVSVCVATVIAAGLAGAQGVASQGQRQRADLGLRLHRSQHGMQYTGSQLCVGLFRRFRGGAGAAARQKAPTGYFPDDAYLITDCVDAVERRLYNVIGHGDESATLMSRPCAKTIRASPSRWAGGRWWPLPGWSC
jgi:hypothetical protein